MDYRKIMETTIKEKIINNCDELLTHLFKACSDTIYASGGNIIFQGDICEIGGFMPDRWCILIPTKVETSASKRYFIVMGHYDEDSWVNLVTENYIEAANKLKDLRCSCDDGYSYRLMIQENGKITSCKNTNWDIDR